MKQTCWLAAVGHPRGVLSRKGTGRDHHGGGRGRNGRRRSNWRSEQQLPPNKSSRFSIVKPAVGTLRIEHTITADMTDGQPLPPLIEDGVVWHLVKRANGCTTWRRLFLTPPVTDRRAAPGGQTRAP